MLEQISITKLRFILAMSVILITALFAVEMPLLPTTLHDAYLISRVGIQLPMLFAVLALTWLSNYEQRHSQIMFVGILVGSLGNFAFYLYAWISETHEFTYEVLFLYVLYSAFLFRIKFSYYLIYAVVNLICFVVINLVWNVSGEYTYIRIAYMTIAIGTCCFGVYQIQVVCIKYTF